MSWHETLPSKTPTPLLERLLAAPGQAILLLMSLPVLAPLLALSLLASRSSSPEGASLSDTWRPALRLEP